MAVFVCGKRTMKQAPWSGATVSTFSPEAGTCLTKLTTLRSFRAGLPETKRHQKLDQANGRNSHEPTSCCRRFRRDTRPHGAATPWERSGAGSPKRLAAGPADAFYQIRIWLAARDQRCAQDKSDSLARCAAKSRPGFLISA